MPLTISLEEEPDIANVSDQKLIGYKLTIELEAELRIGLRGVAEFQYFVTLGTVSEQTIREKCFPGKGPYQQFVICDVRRDGAITSPAAGDRIDQELAVKVAVHDGQVNLVFEDPMQSVEGLKKYFPW